MHCERCGSADTEIIKCKECGQKSRVRCTNCNFSHCTDKYCSVISIKRTIRRLMFLAGGLGILTLGMIPFVYRAVVENASGRRGGKGGKNGTSRPKPTKVAPTKPATRPPTKPATRPPTKKPDDGDAPPFDPADFGESQTFEEKMTQAIRKALKKPYKKGGKSLDGFSYVGLPYWLYKEAGNPIPDSFNGMANLPGKLDTKDWKRFKRGDLLFFCIKRKKSRGKSKPNFVAVYNASGKFVCAHPRAKKVILTGFVAKRVGPWWKKKFLYAIRVNK